MQFVAFDIETTGFLPKVDRILEIAAVRFKDGEVVSSFATLIDPRSPIPATATAVHGITDDMVAGKPYVEQALESFAEFCGEDVLVAHNAPFDSEFIKAEILQHETSAARGLILDSCAMARKVITDAPNYKLGTLVAHLRITADSRFHRAEADSIYCGHLFAHMVKRIFRPGEQVVIENLINLSGGQALRFPCVERSFKQLDFLAQL